MNSKILTGKIYTGMIKAGARNLNINKTVVNDLNVFPIPDGDTGDNMYMTISSGCQSASAKEDCSLSETAQAAANGMLFGARGNSGVILSRIFAGIAKGFEGINEADILQVSKAFTEGIKQSYGAITTPVEGTILTVFKDSVNAANSKISAESTLETYIEDFTAEAKESLKRTPDLLAVLKEAGVVDSGGAGLLYIAEGMKAFLNGEEIRGGSEKEEEKEVLDLDVFGPDSELEFGYCTEFLLRLQNAKTDIENFDIDTFSAYLNEKGNSVVAFRDGSIVKVHVHTFNPGEILEYGRKFGEFLTIKIENMTLQHHNSSVKNRFDESEEKNAGDHDFFRTELRKKYGIVTVAAGEGVKSMFTDIGVDEVVDGGQSMNPSAEDLVKAFEKVNADTVFVLPNNGNIILTAKQAASLYKKSEVRVIETHTVGDGYAVVSMLDLSADTPEEIEAAAYEAMQGVVTGLVSPATRNTEKDGVLITAGDYIGFAGGKIYCSQKSKNSAAFSLSEAVYSENNAVLLLIRGSCTTAEESEELCGKLSEKFTDLEIIPIDGGQPVFDYMLVFE